jgi:hypothetical protein
MFQFNNPLFKVGKCIIVKNRAISNEQQDNNNQYKIHPAIKNGNGILKVNAKLIKINSKEGDNCISLLKETQSTNSSNNSNNNNHL